MITRYRDRNPNSIDLELRRRTEAILRWNLILWPLGLVALAVWVLIRIAG
jgi:hypothetical protein